MKKLEAGDLVFYESYNSLTMDWDVQLLIILEIRTDFNDGDWKRWSPIIVLSGNSAEFCLPYPTDEWYTLTLISKGEFK